MGQEIIVPDWAKQGPSKAFQPLAAQARGDSLSAGIGQGYPVIGYKGKVWQWRHRGERKTFIRPDDGTPAAYLDVIILGQAGQKSKSFFKQYDPNNEGEGPICSSIDGLVPDPDVLAKQCDSCALCPRNVWKTDPKSGKKGRECTDYKRLAVLVLPQMTQAILGSPSLEPAFLRVPPASLNSLAIMGDTMANQGFHYSSYITRITFDPNKAHPEMQFRPIQALRDEEAATVLQMREDDAVSRIVTGGFDGGLKTVGDGPLPPAAALGVAQQSPQQASQQVPQQASQQVPQQASQPQTMEIFPPPHSTVEAFALPMEATPATSMTTDGKNIAESAMPVPASPGMASAPPATPAPTTGVFASPSTIPPGTKQGTVFGGATPAPVAPVSAPQPAQSFADTGAPEATDAALDEQIARLIKRPQQ